MKNMKGDELMSCEEIKAEIAKFPDLVFNLQPGECDPSLAQPDLAHELSEAKQKIVELEKHISDLNHDIEACDSEIAGESW